MFRLVQADEEQSMAAAVRAVVESRSPLHRVAVVADGPDVMDGSLWSALVEDLGATGVLIPVEFGGLGLGWREARVVLNELGRALACVPYVESAVVSPSIILASDDHEAAHDLLPGLADGSTVGTVGFGDEASFSTASPAAITAELRAGTWRVTGAQPFVTFAARADIIFLLARTATDEHGWFALEAPHSSLSIKPMSVIDTTRPQSLVECRATPARLIGDLGDHRVLLQRALLPAVVGSACEQEAASRFLLEATTDYARKRYQFGRPIGSFQALQHRLADLALAVDTSTSAVEYAVWAAADSVSDLPEAASIAGFTCSETFFTAASETIQMHGGIGFTWEHFAQRYFRRALASRVQLGKPSFHRERLLESLSI